MKYFVILFAVLATACNGSRDLKPEDYVTYSKLMHTIQLTENNMCANVILTVACYRHTCDRHINTIKVNCLGSSE